MDVRPGTQHKSTSEDGLWTGALPAINSLPRYSRAVRDVIIAVLYSRRQQSGVLLFVLCLRDAPTIDYPPSLKKSRQSGLAGGLQDRREQTCGFNQLHRRCTALHRNSLHTHLSAFIQAPLYRPDRSLKSGSAVEVVAETLTRWSSKSFHVFFYFLSVSICALHKPAPFRVLLAGWLAGWPASFIQSVIHSFIHPPVLIHTRSKPVLARLSPLHTCPSIRFPFHSSPFPYRACVAMCLYILYVCL